MGRRNETTKDTETEVASSELEHIENTKHTVQSEVLTIADQKKRLEESYGERKREIEDDLAISKRQAEQEKESLSGQNVTLKNENTKLEQANIELRAKNSNLVSERDVLVKDIERSKVELEKLKSGIVPLVEEKKELQKSINDLSPKLAVMQERYSILNRDVIDLEKRKKMIIDDHAVNIAGLKKVTDSHNALVIARDSKQKEVDDIDALLKDKKEALDKSKIEVSDFERIIIHFKQEMDKKTEETNTKMKNAANLEIHVDEKLTHLKEIEKQFTNEHLARMGYKKTE